MHATPWASKRAAAACVAAGQVRSVLGLVLLAERRARLLLVHHLLHLGVLVEERLRVILGCGRLGRRRRTVGRRGSGRRRRRRGPV